MNAQKKKLLLALAFGVTTVGMAVSHANAYENDPNDWIFMDVGSTGGGGPGGGSPMNNTSNFFGSTTGLGGNNNSYVNPLTDPNINGWNGGWENGSPTFEVGIPAPTLTVTMTPVSDPAPAPIDPAHNPFDPFSASVPIDPNATVSAPTVVASLPSFAFQDPGYTQLMGGPTLTPPPATVVASMPPAPVVPSSPLQTAYLGALPAAPEFNDADQQVNLAGTPSDVEQVTGGMPVFTAEASANGTPSATATNNPLTTPNGFATLPQLLASNNPGGLQPGILGNGAGADQGNQTSAAGFFDVLTWRNKSDFLNDTKLQEQILEAVKENLKYGSNALKYLKEHNSTVEYIFQGALSRGSASSPLAKWADNYLNAMFNAAKNGADAAPQILMDSSENVVGALVSGTKIVGVSGASAVQATLDTVTGILTAVKGTSLAQEVGALGAESPKVVSLLEALGPNVAKVAVTLGEVGTATLGVVSSIADGGTAAQVAAGVGLGIVNGINDMYVQGQLGAYGSPQFNPSSVNMLDSIWQGLKNAFTFNSPIQTTSTGGNGAKEAQPNHMYGY